MTISKRDWTEYIRRLSKLDRRAAADVAQYIARYGTGDPAALAEYAAAVVAKYGEGSAELAAQMYDEMAAAEGMNLSPAVPAAPPSAADVAKAIYATLKTPAVMQNAVGRMVKRCGADTTLQNALRDGAEFAWIPGGRGCAFCLTLASRGWQKASKETIAGGHAEHIHANCKCTFAIRFKPSSNVAGYDPEHYLAAYDSADGFTPSDKINSLRREQYAEDRDAINAQKRAAYAARKELRDGGGKKIPIDSSI